MHIGLHQIASLVQQFAAIFAQVANMETFSELQVAFRERVDGLDCRVVGNA